jgi:phosphoribosylpyrophosphate synthetase
MSQVTFPADLVVPISLYEIPGQLHHVLRNYKSGPAANFLRTQVAAMLARFIGLHHGCFEAALATSIQAAMIVPSTRSPQRTGAHPLQLAVRQVSHLNELDIAALKRGSGAVDHRLASDHAFVVEADVRGLTVLLVEDTFTTGARAQSASSALRLAGAARVSVLTVGRVIDPGHNDNCQRIWRQARAQPFDFSRCCLEG